MSIRNTMTYVNDAGGGTRKKPIVDDDDLLLGVASGAYGDQDAAPETTDQAAVPATAEQAAAEQPREKSGYEKWKESGNYQDLVRAYGEQSRRAMDDTLGRVSARTGGLASSYAVGAAEGARDEVMMQLEDVARSMYEGDRADARARIAAYMQNGGDPTMLSDELLQTSGYTVQLIVPIVASGDAIGAVLLLSREPGAAFSGADTKVAETAAAFLGRQMEN